MGLHAGASQPISQAPSRKIEHHESGCRGAERPTSSRASLCSGGDFDWEPALRRLDELNARVEDPTLWDRPDEAQAVIPRALQAGRLGRGGAGAGARGQGRRRTRRTGRDGGRRARSATRPPPRSRRLKDRAARAELEALLSGEADGNDAFVEINSGAGGTESADWALMLMRMYSRWATQHGMTVEVLEETAGRTGRASSRATLQVKGTNAYGWLKTESGVHRLVRISPYDSSARRHTSFASVWVYPVVDDTIVIDINPADVRTDTYRASGSGGQHINKTDSAVRLTHIPTGIAVACQAGRSQHQNREEAWKMLRARLYERSCRSARRPRQALADAEDRHRLGPPDPQLRPAALPDGEGPAHRRGDLRHPGRARRRPRRLHGREPGPARGRDPRRGGGRLSRGRRRPGKPGAHEAEPVVIYHNPACGTSRKVLEAIEAKGIEPQVVRYLQVGWTKASLNRLLDALAMKPRDLLRTKTPAGRGAAREGAGRRSSPPCWPIRRWWSGPSCSPPRARRCAGRPSG